MRGEEPRILKCVNDPVVARHRLTTRASATIPLLHTLRFLILKNPVCLIRGFPSETPSFRADPFIASPRKRCMRARRPGTRAACQSLPHPEPPNEPKMSRRERACASQRIEGSRLLLTEGLPGRD